MSDIDLMSLYAVVNANDMTRIAVNHGDLVVIKVRHDISEGTHRRAVVEVIPIGASGIDLGDLAALLQQHDIVLPQVVSPGVPTGAPRHPDGYVAVVCGTTNVTHYIYVDGNVVDSLDGLTTECGLTTNVISRWHVGETYAFCCYCLVKAGVHVIND